MNAAPENVLRKSTESNLSAEFVRECLDYSPENGVFTWKVRPRHHFVSESAMRIINGKMAGKSPGNMSKAGYLRIGIGGEVFWGHRVAWLVSHGSWPIGSIDHINGIRGDNRLLNLRCALHSENCRNTKLASNNTSGVKGVHFSKRNNRWMAYVGLDGKRANLGAYKTLEEASRAAAIGREKLHGEFCRHR